MVTKKRRKRRSRRRKMTPIARWQRWWRRFKRRLRRRRYSLLVALCVALATLLAAPVAYDYVANLITRERMEASPFFAQYDGIDVSKYQGDIDWYKLSLNPHVKFVYIKATEGAIHVDKRYQENIRKARVAGLRVGSYHFFISQKTPREQFENFRRYVKRSEQDLLPMVDVEHAGNRRAKREQLQQNLAEFMEMVKAEYGQYPIIYSQYKFYNDMLAPEFNHYLIFIARYSDKEPRLNGGGLYNIWQYTEHGTISGIKGHVDLNRFANGTNINHILLRNNEKVKNI